MLFLILVVSGIPFFSGIIKKTNLSNPIIVFNGIWFVCFILYGIKLSKVYTNDISLKAGICFLCMLLAYNLSFFISTRCKHTVVVSNIRLIKATTKYDYIKTLAIIWIFLIGVEVLYCKGFPLVWLISGRKGSYASFGIPSIHGFINSLSWFTLNILLIYYLDSRDKRIFKWGILINIVYFLLLARQSIMTEIIQLTPIYLLKRKVNIKKIGGLLVMTIVIFGIVGNIRTDPKHVLNTAKLSVDSVPFFFMGFVWVYMYMMTPIANMISAIDSWKTLYFGAASLKAFLPTAIVNALGMKDVAINDYSYLISQTYNVSTALLTPYFDFGIAGVFAFSM